MNASRELDADVAEKVLGCRVERKKLGNLMAPYCLCPKQPHGDNGPGLKAYSNAIGPAWELWDALANRTTGFSFTLDWCRVPFLIEHWEASVHMDDLKERVAAQAPTAPLAICIAALRAVGHEVPA